MAGPFSKLRVNLGKLKRWIDRILERLPGV
jgi:hypothetical protein